MIRIWEAELASVGRMYRVYGRVARTTCVYSSVGRCVFPPNNIYQYTHHVAAISSAIVRADALLVRNAAASLAFQLAHAPGPS